MIPKCSSAFFITALTFLAAQGPGVHAAPISRLLSIVPVSSPESSPFSSSLLSPSSSSLSSSPPSLRPLQAKRSPQRRSQRVQRRGIIPSDPHSTTPTSNAIKGETTWQSLQHQDQQSEQKPMVPARAGMMWTDRTLEGHAVVDEDDDDDGNELLDTESEGLWGSDVDDEIGGTIEGEILEEEDYEEHDDKDGVDMDQDEMLDLDAEVWKGVIRKLSMVAGLTRKEAMANSRSSTVGSSPSSASLV